MSAYVVSPQHINALVTFALNSHRGGYGNRQMPSYYWDGARMRITEATADLLWQENIRSVKTHYGDSDDLPGPIDRPDFLAYVSVRVAILDGKRVELQPADIINLCRCLSYQSCESGNWEQTEAYAALQAIRDVAIGMLVDRANPAVQWDI